MKAKTLAATLTALTLPMLALTVAPAEAHARGIYDNCTQLNAKWPNGVGLRRAVDLGPPASERVTHFRRAPKKYRTAVRHNRTLDRDRDGIACEKPSRRPPAPPSQPVQSIEVITRTATAVGDRLDNTPNFVFRPHYTLSATVVCANGDGGFMRVPVWAMSAPGAFFTCTGSRQTVSFDGTAAPNTPGTATVPVTATLVTPEGETSDTQQITLTTKFRS